MNQSMGRCSSFELFAPLFDPGGGAADGSSAAFVTTATIPCAHMAAFSVEGLESFRFAHPARAEAVGEMESSAEDTEAVDPPAITANALTHSNNNYELVRNQN